MPESDQIPNPDDNSFSVKTLEQRQHSSPPGRPVASMSQIRNTCRHFYRGENDLSGGTWEGRNSPPPHGGARHRVASHPPWTSNRARRGGRGSSHRGVQNRSWIFRHHSSRGVCPPSLVPASRSLECIPSLLGDRRVWRGALQKNTRLASLAKPGVFNSHSSDPRPPPGLRASSGPDQ